MKKLLLLLFLLSFSVQDVLGQINSNVAVRLKTGEVKMGILVEETPEYVRLRTSGQEKIYPKSQILKLTYMEQEGKESIKKNTYYGTEDSPGFQTRISIAVPEKEVIPDQQKYNQFLSDFKQCRPGAMFTSGEILGAAAHYQIIGPQNNRCVVKWQYSKNPNPKWVGKEMVCQFDNTKDFEMALQDFSSCQGPLYDLIYHPGGPP